MNNSLSSTCVPTDARQATQSNWFQPGKQSSDQLQKGSVVCQDATGSVATLSETLRSASDKSQHQTRRRRRQRHDPVLVPSVKAFWLYQSDQLSASTERNGQSGSLNSQISKLLAETDADVKWDERIGISPFKRRGWWPCRV